MQDTLNPHFVFHSHNIPYHPLHTVQCLHRPLWGKKIIFGYRPPSSSFTQKLNQKNFWNFLFVQLIRNLMLFDDVFSCNHVAANVAARLHETPADRGRRGGRTVIGNASFRRRFFFLSSCVSLTNINNTHNMTTVAFIADTNAAFSGKEIRINTFITSPPQTASPHQPNHRDDSGNALTSHSQSIIQRVSEIDAQLDRCLGLLLACGRNEVDRDAPSGVTVLGSADAAGATDNRLVLRRRWRRRGNNNGQQQTWRVS